MIALAGGLVVERPEANRSASGCLSRLARAVLIMVAALVGAWLLVFAVLYCRPENKSTPVQSHNGRYSAYLGTRGFIDTVRTHLYVRDQRRGVLSSTPVIYPDGGIKWSPNSVRVAAVTYPVYPRPFCLYVYDVTSNQWVVTRISDPAEIRKISNLPDVDWCWKDNRTIAVFPRGKPNGGILLDVTGKGGAANLKPTNQ